jgi:hypothetical protein
MASSPNLKNNWKMETGNLVRFEVLMVASMKMAVFWVVAPCNLLEIYWHFSKLIALMMESASTSEMLVNFYQTTCRNNPEDSHLQETW